MEEIVPCYHVCPWLWVQSYVFRESQSSAGYDDWNQSSRTCLSSLTYSFVHLHEIENLHKYTNIFNKILSCLIV